MNDPMVKTKDYVEQAGTFGSCPREIRDQIYRLCLVTHVEIIPYPQPHEHRSHSYVKAQFPYPALLAVNKVFGVEARAVLYGENTWRLPPSRPLTDNELSEGLEQKIFGRYPRLFRSVTVFFDQQEASEEYAITLFNETFDEIHARYQYAAERKWSAKSQLLRSLPQLNLITVQLRSFSCPGGCCRYKQLCEAGAFYMHFLKDLTPEALPLLFRGSGKGQEKPEVVVKGLRTAAEQELIHEKFGFEKAEEAQQRPQTPRTLTLAKEFQWLENTRPHI